MSRAFGPPSALSPEPGWVRLALRHAGPRQIGQGLGARIGEGIAQATPRRAAPMAADTPAGQPPEAENTASLLAPQQRARLAPPRPQPAPRAGSAEPQDKPHIFAETDRLAALELPRASRNAIVTFAPRQDGKVLWGHSFLRRFDAAIYGVADVTNTWFPAEDMALLLPALREKLAGYERVILYGFSMGAYAALKYSRALGASTVLAFAPQYSITPEDAGHFDRRRPRLFYRPDLHAGMRLQAGDLGGEALVFYDPLFREDAQHVALISRCGPLRRVLMPFTNHDTLRFAMATKILEPLFQACLAGTPPGAAELRRWIRPRRAAATHYVEEIPLRLGKRREAQGKAPRPAFPEHFLDPAAPLASPQPSLLGGPPLLMPAPAALASPPLASPQMTAPESGATEPSSTGTLPEEQTDGQTGGQTGGQAEGPSPAATPRIFAETERIALLELPRAARSAIVTFAPRQKAKTLWGGAFLPRFEAAIFGVTDVSESWFPAEDMALLLPALREKLAGYERVILYGFSMGAYAALKYSRALGADAVLAFAPQFSITPEDVGAFDKRRPATYYQPALHDGMRITAGDIGGAVTLFYDPFFKGDVRHAGRILECCPAARTVLTPFSNHETLRFAIDTKVIQPVLQALIDGAPLAPATIRQMLRARRRASARYLAEATARLERRRLRRARQAPPEA
ncbi:hypothetical protein NON00_03540 [Roseomonas sp. GC11]|uniref:hypothetical protein n=1 Tax=Roseomonas sp. GC11 TaxID=2950546 RepID=UPI00210A5D29|nr:hypothetical protein [Roseomonas sp. GC11]MCQ4158996.1 hypothetical protein [Roseomonas sp. GC11]